MHVYRFSIANILPGALAQLAAGAGLPGGTVTEATGFWGGASYGVEQTSVLEVATGDSGALFAFVADVLEHAGEECAYFTTDGAGARLLYASGALERVA